MTINSKTLFTISSMTFFRCQSIFIFYLFPVTPSPLTPKQVIRALSQLIIILVAKAKYISIEVLVSPTD